VTTDQIVNVAIGALTLGGGGLSAAVAAGWSHIQKRINTCEEDRAKLHTKIEDLNGDILNVSTALARVKTHLEHLDKRQDSSDAKSKE